MFNIFKKKIACVEKNYKIDKFETLLSSEVKFAVCNRFVNQIGEYK